jgi:hypothetical protein
MPTLTGQLFLSKVIKPSTVKNLGSDSFVVSAVAPNFSFGLVWVDTDKLIASAGVWVENLGPTNISAVAFRVASEKQGGGLTVILQQETYTGSPGGKVFLPLPTFGWFQSSGPQNWAGNFASMQLGVQRQAVADLTVSIQYAGG